MTSLRGKNVILKGWEKTSINDGIELETAGLPILDPFDEVDPIFRGRKEILDYNLMVALMYQQRLFSRTVYNCARRRW